MALVILAGFIAIILVLFIMSRKKPKIRSKTFLIESLLIIGVLGFGVLARIIWFDTPNQSPQSSSVIKHVKNYPPPKKQVSYGYPLRLKIPAINVDAALDYVSLTKAGELGIPKGPNSVGWYDRGPLPGEKGSSVMDGHFGYVNNIPAVFDNLSKLQPGDNLYVLDDRGSTVTFAVSSLQTYGHDQIVSSVFHSNDGRAHLNLITCEGTWNEAEKSYSNRLVVFTDKVL